MNACICQLCSVSEITFITRRSSMTASFLDFKIKIELGNTSKQRGILAFKDCEVRFRMIVTSFNIHGLATFENSFA